jgi:hypothetical protein
MYNGHTRLCGNRSTDSKVERGLQFSFEKIDQQTVNLHLLTRINCDEVKIKPEAAVTEKKSATKKR